MRENNIWDQDKVNFLSEYWNPESDYRQFILNEIIKEKHKDPGLNILDAGCGTGYLFKILPDWVKPDYTGIDFSPNMIAYCKKNYPKWEDRFKRVDILERESIPRRDLIITQNVIQHITLFQIATWNLVSKANKMIMFCERTKIREKTVKNRVPLWVKPFLKISGVKPRVETPNTEIRGYEPTRWRFNETDILELLSYLGNLYEYREPQVIGYPVSTDELSGVLAVYKMVKK